MSIELHIGRLVLDGVPLPRGRERQLGAALQRELTVLLSAHGVGDRLRGHGSVHALQGTVVPMHGDVGAGRLGRQIAGSIFAGLTR